MKEDVSQVVLGDLNDLQKRIWRKSHSLKSLETFNYCAKLFKEFLSTNTKTDPYKIIDGFITWLDERCYSPKTIRLCVSIAKNILSEKYDIRNEVLRRKVILPTPQIFFDDKIGEDDLRNLIIHAQGRLKPFIALLKDAPVRPIEIIGLQLMHFNFSHNPPYYIIPAYVSKNDIEREVFFTHETKDVLEAYLKNKGIKEPDQYIFLLREPPNDEIGFQRCLIEAKKRLENAFRELLKKPCFKHLRTIVRGRRKDIRYKIHPYSLKKFSFTKIADTLGELQAHAMAGHKAYLITYYKKSREERAKDYMKVIPKLSVLSPSIKEDEKKRDEIESCITSLSSEQLDAILKLARNLASGNRQ